MPTLQELRDKRANIWSQMQEIDARGKAATDGILAEADRTAWDKADGELTGLTGEIERQEKHEKLDKRFSELDDENVERRAQTPENPVEKEQRAAFEGWLRHGMTEMEPEQRKTLRAMGTTIGSAGGYTVPDEFWAKVTEAKKLFSVISGKAENIVTATGGDIEWATNDDTANEGEIIAENAAATETELVFGQKKLGAHLYSTKMVRVSLNLLQDSAVDLGSFIPRKLGERLGRVEQRHFTVGIGAPVQPQGLIAGSTTGKTTAGSTAIIWEELIDLIHSVDAAYREAGDCEFNMHDLVLAYVRKLKDLNGLPLWQPSVQAGKPDTLLGYPVGINNYMDSTLATTKKTIGFGSIRQAFVVRTVQGGSMRRLDERYAEYNQVAFLGFERADALVQDTGAYKLLVQV